MLLKYIPITIRNYVSVFDIDKATFIGPKYNGSHLVSSLNRCKSLATDSLIYLHLVSHTLKFYFRVAFLCQNSILFQNSDEYKLDKCNNQVTNSKAIDSGSSRKTSVQPTNFHISRRERILRFYSMSNEQATPSPTTQAAASVFGSSIASIFSYSDVKNKDRRPSLNSQASQSNDIDVELLRLVLAASSSFASNQNNNNSLFSNSSSSLLFVTPTPVESSPQTSRRKFFF